MKRSRKTTIWWALSTVLFVPISEGNEDSLSPEQLQRRFVDSFEDGDLAASLRYGEELAVHFPDSAELAFDLSRLRILNSDPEKALAWLERSVETGFAQVEKFDAEPDLVSLRSLPEYPGLRARIVENQRTAWENFKHRVAAQPAKLWAPRGGDPLKPRPLIIALHGRGGRAETLARIWQPEAQRLKAVLATPQGLEPYAGGHEWGSPKETAYQVLEAVALAQAGYAIDPKQILLTGFSQGGGRSIGVAFENPGLFAGVIVVGSAMDRETSFPPVPTPADATIPRFFFMVGADDRGLPRTRATSQNFAKHGIVHELAVYADVGHDFPRDYRRQLRRATEFVLRPD